MQVKLEVTKETGNHGNHRLLHHRLLLLHHDWSRGHTTNDCLGLVLRFEVNVSGRETHVLKFDPLLSTHWLSEETHRDLSMTNHLVALHISVFNDNFDNVVHVNNFELKELECPHGVFSTALNNHGSLFATINFYNNEG
jgi:hypothetical protein